MGVVTEKEGGREKKVKSEKHGGKDTGYVQRLLISPREPAQPHFMIKSLWWSPARQKGKRKTYKDTQYTLSRMKVA